MDNSEKSQTVAGITYTTLPQKEIQKYVIETCEKEWGSEDFVLYGDDLYKSVWQLKLVNVSDIHPNPDLLAQESFQKDLKPRIENQDKLYKAGIPISPLILRDRDLFIFDGYARYHFFAKEGIEQCLAYIGSR